MAAFEVGSDALIRQGSCCSGSGVGDSLRSRRGSSVAKNADDFPCLVTQISARRCFFLDPSVLFYTNASSMDNGRLPINNELPFFFFCKSEDWLHCAYMHIGKSEASPMY